MPEPPKNEMLGTALNQRYLLERQLGGGGMGAVYLAKDLETSDGPNAQVALKLLAPPKGATEETFEKRMLREIKVLMLAEDPRVIALLDWGRDAQHGLFYTMEMLEHTTSLKDHVASQPPHFWEIVRLLREILCGLNALHEIKVIHRDIKPANILCVGDGNEPAIKLIDPGIAKWFPDDLRTQVTVETAAGGFVGTPPYTAPEMWQGLDLDARTDIYQCGIMAYELLTGEQPFTGTLYNVMFQHIQKPMPSVIPKATHKWPELSPEVLNGIDACIKRATSKEPKERYSSARDFITALDAMAPSTTKVPPQQEETASIGIAFAPEQQSPPKIGVPLPTASSLVAPQQDDDALPNAKTPYALLGIAVVLCLGVGLWLVRHVMTPTPQKQPAQTRTPVTIDDNSRPTPKKKKATAPRNKPRIRAKQTPRQVTRPTPKRNAKRRRKTKPRKRSRITRPGALDTLLPQ